VRTTLNLDDDVLERARAVAGKLRSPFRTVVNEALRKGLASVEAPAPRRPYRTRPHRMGVRAGRNLDNVQDLLAQVDGEGAR
jgi:hypothetical protein